MMKIRIVLILMTLAVLPLYRTAAQSDAETLFLMQSVRADLATEASREWQFAPTVDSTLYVETLSGSLDPALTVLDADGEQVAQNDDFAAEFSPAARVVVAGGAEYVVRVDSRFGAGTFRLWALPGDVMPQWDEDFPLANPFWQIAGASPNGDGIALQTPMTTTWLYTPLGAPASRDVYLQATLTWEDARAGSEVGLVVRGRDTGAAVSGIRFEVDTAGAWSLRRNDGMGNEETLQNGRLPANGDNLTLGLLAQGDQVVALASGQVLATAQDTTSADTNWGVVVYDARVTLTDFWLATPSTAPPTFPATLSTWDSDDSNAITAELQDAGILPDDGQRQFLTPRSTYTVSGIDHRSFLVNASDQTFEDVVLGGDIRFGAAEDVGCGLVVRFRNADHKTLAYVDQQTGVGVLRWTGDGLPLNDYSLLPDDPTDETRLLMVLQDQYLGVYVNGILTTQALIPRREGNVAVGFVNFVESAATCDFFNVWAWD